MGRGADSRGASKALDWFQPAFGTLRYELRGDEGVTAQLEFEPKPSVSWDFTDPRAARATAGALQWRFTVSRQGVAGFFGAIATVHLTGSHTGTIEARNFASRGILHIAGGRRFKWQGKLIRGATSVFSNDDPNATPLMRFRSGSPLARVTTHVEVTPQGLATREWLLLAPLGFYLRMLMNRTWR